MKKVISIIAMIVGGLFLLSGVAPMIMGIILKVQIASSVGIIGGADGPTAIMLVGTLGTDSVIIEIVTGVLLIVVGVWGLQKTRRKLK